MTDDDGSDFVVGHASKSHIELSRGLLDRFSSAKEMTLALFFDITRSSSIKISKTQENELSFEAADEFSRMSFSDARDEKIRRLSSHVHEN